MLIMKILGVAPALAALALCFPANALAQKEPLLDSGDSSAQEDAPAPEEESSSAQAGNATEAPPSLPQTLEPPPSLPEVPAPEPIPSAPAEPSATAAQAGATEQVLPESGAPNATSIPPYTPHSNLFVDLVLAGFNFGDRIGQFANIGGEFGGVIGQRLRLTVRALLPTEDLNDNGAQVIFNSDTNSNAAYTRLKSEPAGFLYGATIGVVAAAKKTFSFAPGVALMRSNVSDYGSTAAINLPFEWEPRPGFRVGFALALGRSFGGYYREVCTGAASAGLCIPGDERKVDRLAGTAVYAQFGVGWGISQPAASPANLARVRTPGSTRW